MSRPSRHDFLKCGRKTLINLVHIEQISIIMDCCFPCCKYTAFFGIIFYVSMALIVGLQPNYLRFAPENSTNTVIACALTALLQAFIFVSLHWYQYKKRKGAVSQPEYLKFDEERHQRPRQSSFKGIAMVNLQGIRRENEEEQRREEEIL